MDISGTFGMIDLKYNASMDNVLLITESCKIQFYSPTAVFVESSIINKLDLENMSTCLSSLKLPTIIKGILICRNFQALTPW